MNERLIELMNEANKDAGFTFSMDQAKPVHDLMEKFAELIVKECASLVVDDDNAYDMLKHFGVEE
jgi:hypothetical protein